MPDGGSPTKRVVRGPCSMSEKVYLARKAPRQKPYGKYGNIKTVVDGIKFMSKREAARYQQLKLLEKAERIRGLKLQTRYELEVNGTRICRYVSDFDYEEFEKGAWTPIVEDCKGFRTPEYKLKAKLMLACHRIAIRET